MHIGSPQTIRVCHIFRFSKNPEILENLISIMLTNRFRIKHDSYAKSMFFTEKIEIFAWKSPQLPNKSNMQKMFVNLEGVTLWLTWRLPACLGGGLSEKMLNRTIFCLIRTIFQVLKNVLFALFFPA